MVAFLSKASLFSIEDNVLHLKVGFIFHKKRIEQETSRKAISSVIKDTVGLDIDISCEVDNDMKVSEVKNEKVTESNIDLVEEIFGEEGV